MSDNPESNRPLLAPTTPFSAYGPRHSQSRARLLLLAACGTLVLLIGSSYLCFGPSAGLSIQDRLAPYYTHPMFPGAHGGNAPPPAHGSGHEEHPHPGAPPGGGRHLLTGRTRYLRPIPTRLRHPTTPPQRTSPPSCLRRLESQPAHPPRCACALYTGDLPPPLKKGFDAFFAYAKERGCLVDGYAGVWRDLAPFWTVEMGVAAQRVGKSGGRLEGINKGGREGGGGGEEDTHGIAALTIRDGHAHKPEHQVTYFDGDWEGKVNKFASALPPMTVLINSRDEPHVVFDVGPVFEDPPTLTQALTLADPLRTLAPAHGRALCAAGKKGRMLPRAGRGRGGGCSFTLLLRAAGLMEGDVSRRWKAEALLSFPGCLLVSASSAAFTTDLVPVLSMTKLADASTGGGAEGGRGSCFADVLVPGEGSFQEWGGLYGSVQIGDVGIDVGFDGFYYRNSWWAGKFKYPNNVKWEDKEVLYWRGKSNGGHIRDTNYRSFPRFWLIDLAALPENRAKGLFDVRITQWHEWHCTDDCDADATRNTYNITGESAPREEAWQYKYLLDVNGNTFSGRSCARMKCRHRCADVRIGAASSREQREGRSEGLVVGSSFHFGSNNSSSHT
ncbi:hypothetical protein B0H13DRAFT_2451713 [Mycena leptocephala]|nr:hypothetical protein B0H13DRAFT_2451713 [Mycena leptocephala]